MIDPADKSIAMQLAALSGCRTDEPTCDCPAGFKHLATCVLVTGEEEGEE